MNYTITAINNRRINPDEYECITLCPICHKHFIIDSVFDYPGCDSDYLSTVRCTICNARFTALYNHCNSYVSHFDGFYDKLTDEYLPLYNFPNNVTIYSDREVLRSLNAVCSDNCEPSDYIDSSCIPFFPSNYNPNDPEFTGEYEGPAYDFNDDNLPF